VFDELNKAHFTLKNEFEIFKAAIETRLSANEKKVTTLFGRFSSGGVSGESSQININNVD
jgi:hypothetical protein